VPEFLQDEQNFQEFTDKKNFELQNPEEMKHIATIERE
jgi:hypothetical protein